MSPPPGAAVRVAERKNRGPPRSTITEPAVPRLGKLADRAPTARSSTPLPSTSPTPAMRDAQQAADAGQEAGRAGAGRGQVDVGEPGPTPDHVDCAARPALGAGPEGRADGDVVEAVAVHVAGPGHEADLLVRPAEDADRPPRGRREVDVGRRRRSEYDEGAARAGRR